MTAIVGPPTWIPHRGADRALCGRREAACICDRFSRGLYIVGHAGRCLGGCRRRAGGGMTDDRELAGLDPFALLDTEAGRLDAFLSGLGEAGWQRASRCAETPAGDPACRRAYGRHRWIDHRRARRRRADRGRDGPAGRDIRVQRQTPRPPVDDAVTRRGRPSKGHALIVGPLAPRRERGLQPEGPAGIASARLLTPRNRFRAVMAWP